MPFPPTHPALARALDARGYAEPTPVQAAVLEPGTEGRDLLVSAQTGSGKTVAYGLAFAATLLGAEPRFEPAAKPLALIVAPTRELAMQVHRELSWLYAETGARIVSCVGGMDARSEARALERGCHIVVGTPGRLCDHLRREQIDFSSIRVVVLDEADEMLDLGFREELDQILGATPDWRRTLLFSATIAREIAAMARDFQKDAVRIDTLVRNAPHADIAYRAVRVAPHEAEHAVVNVLRFYESPTALVFCATREAVRHLHGQLVERGFTCVALSGELTQNERTRALQALREGQARVCVATDVAARGLDLPDLGLVVHADLPIDRATLLHRSGRTGRAGRKGVCVLVVPAPRQRRAELLLSQAGVSAEWTPAPSVDDIRARDAERLAEDEALTGEPAAEELALAQTLLAGRTPEQIAAALVRMYRARLPAPEEISDTWTPPRRERERGPAREDRAPQERAQHEQKGPAEVVWFSINLGRDAKADPKWLLPLICRKGDVRKPDVGAIRIFDHETTFGIRREVADAFASAWEDEDELHLRPAGPPRPGGPPRGAPRGPAHAPSGKPRRFEAERPQRKRFRPA